MPVVAQTEIDEDREYTVDEFMRLNFDERVELVDGKIIRMGWNNFTHARLVSWLSCVLNNWAEATKWGFIGGGDAGVLTKVSPKQTARGADLVAISHGRYADVKQKGKIIDLGPELIIEVVSPSNTWNDIQTKIQEYFSIGTNEIWVISPINRNVTVYHSLKEITSFSSADNEVVTSEWLPGFELSLKELAERIDELGYQEKE
jgi:Uma2 family endonuclease